MTRAARTVSQLSAAKGCDNNGIFCLDVGTDVENVVHLEPGPGDLEREHAEGDRGNALWTMVCFTNCSFWMSNICQKRCRSHRIINVKLAPACSEQTMWSNCPIFCFKRVSSPTLPRPHEFIHSCLRRNPNNVGTVMRHHHLQGGARRRRNRDSQEYAHRGGNSICVNCSNWAC